MALVDATPLDLELDDADDPPQLEAPLSPGSELPQTDFANWTQDDEMSPAELASWCELRLSEQGMSSQPAEPVATEDQPR